MNSKHVVNAILIYYIANIFQIHDKPSLKERAVLLDMSKGRIPTVVCKIIIYLGCHLKVLQ